MLTVPVSCHKNLACEYFCRGFYLLTLVAFLGWPSNGAAGESETMFAGIVTEEESGRALGGVLVSLSSNAKQGIRSHSTFSAPDGSFSLSIDPGLSKEAPLISFKRVGYVESARTGGKEELDVTMSPVNDISSQVSNAAWLDHVARGPEASDAKGALLLVCSTCHTFPSEEVNGFIHRIGALDQEARRAAWLGMAIRMDNYFRQNFSEEGAEESKFAEESGSRGIFILKQDREILSTLLARIATPSNLSDVPPEAAAPRFDTYGPEAGTTLTEYQLPPGAKTFRREVVAPTDTDFIWGVDQYQDKLFRLEPSTGSLRWIEIPGVKQGPHTINRDAFGNIWLALEGGEALAKFEPGTASWEVFRYGHLSEEQMLAHDIAYDKDHNVVADVNGYIWLTTITTNQLVSVNPETGDVRLHHVPLPADRAPSEALLYGTIMSPDRTKIYWTQLRGNVGVTDVRTGESSVVLDLPPYSGPRRMAVDEHNRLWVPLTAAGEIISLDISTGKEKSRYPLPYRSGGVYAVAWDSQRQRLWCATIATDSILALEPETGKWIEYPLLTKGAIFRVLSVAEDGRVWGSYSARGQIAESRVLQRDEIVVALNPGQGDNPERSRSSTTKTAGSR